MRELSCVSVLPKRTCVSCPLFPFLRNIHTRTLPRFHYQKTYTRIFDFTSFFEILSLISRNLGNVIYRGIISFNGGIILEVYQSKIMTEATKYPSLLAYERILYHRMNKFNNHRYYYENLEKGDFGEQDAVKLLKQFGMDHWIVIRNIWLNQNGRFECDILLITSHCLYVFEVKNFDGVFEYKDGDCFLNGKLLSNNCIFQAQKAFRNMKQIIQRLPFSVNIKGALLFIGEFNTVKIHSMVNDIATISRSDFKKYILKIISDESSHLKQLNTESVKNHLQIFETNNPFMPKPIKPEVMQGLRKGIYCVHCQSFGLTIKKHKIFCRRCKGTETRDEAMVRTICEYGILNFDQHLYQNEVMSFINYQASPKYLIKILKTHFGMVKKIAIHII